MKQLLNSCVLFAALVVISGCSFAGDRGLCQSAAVCHVGPTGTVAKSYMVHRDEFRVTRSKAKTSTRFRTGNVKAWAQREAKLMAQRGTCGHVQSAPPGTFVGVGCNGQTCRGFGRPIATAHYKGKTVRVWRN